MFKMRFRFVCFIVYLVAYRYSRTDAVPYFAIPYTVVERCRCAVQCLFSDTSSERADF